MRCRKLAYAALLLAGVTTNGAVASEPPTGHPTRNAQKALVVLAAVGLDNTDVKSLVQEIDTRSTVERGYFYLGEERVGGGTARLHYVIQDDNNYILKSHGTLNKFELRYTPDDSNFSGVARRDRLMIEYRLKLN